MTSSRRLLRCLRIAGTMISLVGLHFSAQAQLKDPDEEAWLESATTLPAAFNAERLQSFDVSTGSTMSYGIDPQTLSVGGDGVVRYVLVARSSSGALNALYQGVRCQSGEVKTYGRWNNNASSWNTGNKEEWQPLSFSGATRPAMMLARAALCDGRTVNGSAQKILDTLKHGRPETR